MCRQVTWSPDPADGGRLNSCAVERPELQTAAATAENMRESCAPFFIWSFLGSDGILAWLLAVVAVTLSRRVGGRSEGQPDGNPSPLSLSLSPSISLSLSLSLSRSWSLSLALSLSLSLVFFSLYFFALWHLLCVSLYCSICRTRTHKHTRTHTHTHTDTHSYTQTLIHSHR